MQKKSQKKKKKKVEKRNTVAQSIPFLHLFKDGIMEVQEGVYSKSYIVPDVNFRTAGQIDQQNIVRQFSELLASLGNSVQTQISLINETVDILQFQEDTLLEMKSDNLNPYREEYNEMLLDKMTGAKNNIQTKRVITLTVKALDEDEAREQFTQLDGVLGDGMTVLTKKATLSMTADERLEMLNQIYNQDASSKLIRSGKIDGHEASSFTIENCYAQGVDPKEVFCPATLVFKRNIAELGEVLAKTFYISGYPTWLKASLMSDFTKLSANMIVTTNLIPMEQTEAIRKIKGQRVNIAANIVANQKSSARDGIDASLISPDLNDAKDEAEDMMAEITKDNGMAFRVNTLITIFASNEEELARIEKQLKGIENKLLINIRPMGWLMEEGFNSCLPVGNNTCGIERMLLSNTVGAFSPFDVKEIRQKHGKYYGLNASSRNMILYDRTTNVNPNGCILGMPGAGKSFAAKREMLNVILNTDDDVFILDPEGEYSALVRAMGGSVIDVIAGSNIYINPFDLNVENKEDGGDPVKVKASFIQTVCEIAVGGRYGLGPVQESIIDRCVLAIYDDYIQHLKDTGLTMDPAFAPTMQDFYDELLAQPQVEAQD